MKSDRGEFVKTGKGIIYGVQKIANTTLQKKGSSKTDKILAQFILSKAPVTVEMQERMLNISNSVLDNPLKYNVNTRRMAGYIVSVLRRG